MLILLLRLLALSLGTLSVLVARAEGAKTYTLEDAREALGDAPNFAQLQYAPASLHLKADRPALSITPGAHQHHEPPSARTMAHQLWRAHGYTLALVSKIDGVDVPAYDGLVFNSEHDVIANLSFKSVRGSAKLNESVARAIRRVNVFSRFENWPQFVLTSVYDAIHFERQSVNELTLHTPYYQRRYEKLIEASRRMVETFGVSTRRPTWLLIDVRDEAPLPAGAYDEVRAMLVGDSPLTRVYLHQHGRLTLIRHRGLDLYRFCQSNLVAAE